MRVRREYSCNGSLSQSVFFYRSPRFCYKLQLLFVCLKFKVSVTFVNRSKSAVRFNQPQNQIIPPNSVQFAD